MSYALGMNVGADFAKNLKSIRVKIKYRPINQRFSTALKIPTLLTPRS